MKQLVRLAAALAMVVPPAIAWTQSVDGAIRRPTLIACDQPEWAPEALRYELEGTTVLEHDVDDEGRSTAIHVARSSGWKILDRMAIRALASCRYQPTTDPQVVRERLSIPYHWKLADNAQKTVSAALVAGSCAPSKHIAEFLPFTGQVKPRNDGILVRFLLDEEGKAFGIKVEETDPSPENMAGAFVRSCRFAPATVDGKPARGNLFGWLRFRKVTE